MSGEFGIARDNGLHDEQVLGCGGGESLGVVLRQPTNPHEVSAHALECRNQVRILHGIVDRVIESSHETVVAVALGVVVLDEFADIEELRLESRECVPLVTERGESGRLRLEGLTHLEQFADVLERDIRDDESPASLGGDEAVRHQPGEGFPERSARDAQPRGLLDLPEHAAGGQFPIDDLVAQRTVGAIAGFDHHTSRCVYRTYPDARLYATV